MADFSPESCRTLANVLLVLIWNCAVAKALSAGLT